MLFDFFKKKIQSDQFPQEELEPTLSSITYFIKQDGSGPYINIELADYDESSCKAICDLLNTLSTESCYAQTVDMLKSSLIQDGAEQFLLKVFTHISKHTREKIINSYKESVRNEPCIKPSDML